LGDQRYLLSPQDLAAYWLVPDLIDAGVGALKIEGRLKTAEYVANITRLYRQAIDSAVAGVPVQFTPRQVEEMELSFSRGFSPGWLRGCDHKALVPATHSAKRGVRIGKVLGVDRGRVRVALQGRLKAGDGVELEGDRAAGEQQGGRLFGIYRKGRRVAGEVDRGVVELSFHRHAIDLDRVWVGQPVWKNDDPALNRRLRKSFSGDVQGKALSLDVDVTARVGEPLRLEVRAPGLPAIRAASDQPLQAATRHRLTRDVLEGQLGRLGGSGFVLGRLTAIIEGGPMVPLSVLGKLRREVLARLVSARDTAAVASHPVAPEPVVAQLRRQLADAAPEPGQPRLLVLCRSLPQLETTVQLDLSTLYADFPDIRQYGDAVDLAHRQGRRIVLATPRIQKPGELGIFHALARQRADGILVRNLAGLDYFTRRGVPCVADYSLNAANELTVDALRRLGAVRVTMSYDLNRDQMFDLVRAAPAGSLEVVVHQHMPMFHMEHCVFCAVLSPGTNKTNCGRPCDRHQVQLRDRVGAQHPLQADVGCRNTLYNAVAQSGAEAVDELRRQGVRFFRIELLEQKTPTEIRRVVELYRDLVRGERTGREVWTTLKAVNRLGVTRGTMEHDRDPLAIL
jgi:putative protease